MSNGIDSLSLKNKLKFSVDGNFYKAFLLTTDEEVLKIEVYYNKTRPPLRVNSKIASRAFLSKFKRFSGRLKGNAEAQT